MIEAVDRILVVDTPIVSDTSIQKENLISIFPSSGSSLNQHGEINFVIETCDQYLHLHKSYIYMECELLKSDDTALAETDEVSLTNNAPMFLFDRSTYSMDGMQVESIMDPGRASLMKGLLTYSSTMNKQNTFGQLECYNIPNGNREFTWKLGTKYDKIKYIVVALQSNRDNNYLNAERYPHDCLKFDFDKFNAVQQYNFAKEFRNSYYESTKDYIFMEEDVYYYYYPLLVFDVSKQNDRIIQSRPDVTIKASFSKSIVQNTKCYCLIMSENIVEIKDNRVKVVSV
ncbi:Protein CBG21635 [Caenorhabditis briggsae]|uniref:Protein CBG21635 n=1 Tax=Caenorhabditis briggsae TaxID=6238 RepID=A8Y093_CAEBR|nr:Protein CBG21635 [Caenorhabditis briggsae]CAP38383.1 Protein CBG21635 [Caenorhabditis briggsae]